MTDEDVPRSAELHTLLGRARKASPPRARLDAVRARLESELGPLGPPPEPPAESAPPARQAPSWLAPAGAVVVLALALVAIVARQPAPDESGVVESHGSPTEQGVSHDPSPEASPSEPTAPELTAPERTAPEVPAPEVTTAPEPDRAREPARERTAPTPERASSDGVAIERDGSSDPPTDEAARASQLREEIAILERAMSRRREGDLEGARAAIAEHARRFPEGLLAPERERLTSELE